MSPYHPPTTFWWLRHAPVLHNGRLYGGGSDWPAEIDPADSLWARFAAALPDEALWVTSGMQRAEQTAAALLPHRPGDAIALREAAFAEQRFGAWEGRTWAELEADEPGPVGDFWAAPHACRPPGGESFVDHIRRVGEAALQLAEAHQGRDIVVVCHGGTVRAALAFALALAPERAQAISVDNNSLTCTAHHRLCDEAIGAEGARSFLRPSPPSPPAPADAARRRIGHGTPPPAAKSAPAAGAWTLHFSNLTFAEQRHKEALP